MRGQHRALLILLLLTCALFVPSLANGFAMDDVPLAQSVDVGGGPDPVIAELHPPWWFFGQRYWASVDNNSTLYRPVTVASYALTYHAVCRWLPASWEALPHHLINILLHAACVWLVFRMVRDLGGAPAGALAAAAVFACHAVHSEVVAGIVGRAELFAFGFGLAATLSFVARRRVSAAVLFWLAFCSKESALAWVGFLPCYLLVRDLRSGPGEPWSARGRALLWVLGSGLLGFFVLRQVAVDGLIGALPAYEQNPLAHVSAGVRILSAVRILGYGLWLCAAPFELYGIYGPGVFPRVEHASDPGFLAAASVLGAVLAVGLATLRRTPLLFLAAATFLGFSFITSNIPFAIGTVFGERLLYMPSLAVSLLVLSLVERVAGRLRVAVLLALSLWCAACAVVILQRNPAWRDNTSLFLGDADRLPESAELQAKAGYVWMAREPERALRYFHRSVSRDPELAASWASIARIHEQRGELAEAEKFYRRALASRYVAASGAEARTVDDLLGVLRRQNKAAAMYALAQEVLRRSPEHFGARLVRIDFGAGKETPEQHYAAITEGLRHHPRSVELLLREAMHRYDHHPDSAEENRDIAARLRFALQNLTPRQRDDSQGVRARLYLGDLLARAGDSAHALEMFRGVLQVEGLSPEVRTQIEAQMRKLAK
ncbi:MAG: tetratricopeptide repeat protein [Planctomycetes bacterium]|nr:tetratricopeptide repeat protein [Planctomycetota bacterium]